jgi:hypothetical protein
LEVNQQIVISWLKSKKFFVIEELFYGQHNNDVDVLAVSLNEELIYDCEVKCRLKTKMDKAMFNKVVDEYQNPLRLGKIGQFIGDAERFSLKKVFITTKFLLGSEKNRDKWEGKFREQNIEVFYLDDILQELSDFASETSKTNDLTIQIFRLFNRD